MEHIRKAAPQDASRLAEILIFAKRVAYRPIFQNDAVSFGQMQVLPLANEYLSSPEKLENIWEIPQRTCVLCVPFNRFSVRTANARADLEFGSINLVKGEKKIWNYYLVFVMIVILLNMTK